MWQDVASFTYCPKGGDPEPFLAIARRSAPRKSSSVASSGESSMYSAGVRTGGISISFSFRTRPPLPRKVSSVLMVRRGHEAELAGAGGDLDGEGGGGFGRGGGRIELSPQFALEPGLSINQVKLPQGNFTTQLITTRSTYTFTPTMFISALVQYNSSNSAVSSNVRLRWEYQPGSELFVVYNDQRDTLMPGRLSEFQTRTFIIKFNRLFRL